MGKIKKEYLDSAQLKNLSKEDKEVLETLFQDAENGEDDAEYTLGYMLFYGEKPFKQNYYEAGKWLHKASLKGSIDAIYLLACIFEEGLGVEKNINQALVLLDMAAEHEQAEAQWKLGSWYVMGKNVDENLEKGINLWEKAAKQDNAEALMSLGFAYLNGVENKLEKNQSIALSYFLKAKQLGYGLAEEYIKKITSE